MAAGALPRFAGSTQKPVLLGIFLSPAAFKMSTSSPPTSGTPLPLHLVAINGDTGALLRHRRGPGRPRKVVRAPDSDGLAHAEVTRRALRQHVEGDPLVSAAASRASSVDVLRAALVATAGEAASISWELERRPLGREAERARSRRLDALVAVARLVQQIASEEKGAPPPGLVERVRDLWLRDVAQVAAEVLAPEDAATLIEGARSRIESRTERATGAPRSAEPAADVIVRS